MTQLLSFVCMDTAAVGRELEKQAQTLTIIPEQLSQTAALAAKGELRARMQALLRNLLHHRHCRAADAQRKKADLQCGDRLIECALSVVAGAGFEPATFRL